MREWYINGIAVGRHLFDRYHALSPANIKRVDNYITLCMYEGSFASTICAALDNYIDYLNNSGPVLNQYSIGKLVVPKDVWEEFCILREHNQALILKDINDPNLNMKDIATGIRSLIKVQEKEDMAIPPGLALPTRVGQYFSSIMSNDWEALDRDAQRYFIDQVKRNSSVLDWNSVQGMQDYFRRLFIASKEHSMPTFTTSKLDIEPSPNKGKSIKGHTDVAALPTTSIISVYQNLKVAKELMEEDSFTPEELQEVYGFIEQDYATGLDLLRSEMAYRRDLERLTRIAQLKAENVELMSQEERRALVQKELAALEAQTPGTKVKGKGKST